jgi:hypothetical protein
MPTRKPNEQSSGKAHTTSQDDILGAKRAAREAVARRGAQLCRDGALYPQGRGIEYRYVPERCARVRKENAAQRKTKDFWKGDSQRMQSLLEQVRLKKASARAAMLRDAAAMHKHQAGGLVQAGDFALSGVRSCLTEAAKPSATADTVVSVLRKRIGDHDDGRIVRMGYATFVEWYVLALLCEMLALHSQGTTLLSSKIKRPIQ